MPPELAAIPFPYLPDDALVRKPIVLAISGKSNSALYADARDGTFPAPVKLGASRSSGWRVGELRRWLADPSGYAAPQGAPK